MQSSESLSKSEKGKKTSKPCKFIMVVDPYARQQIVNLASPPDQATNFIFWQNVENSSQEYQSNNTWGIYIY